jgi:hypothetical protein
MTNDRFKFRAWVEDVDLEDENGNEYKKSFMIYDIAVFGGYRVGHYGEDLERQLESQGFSEDEIEQFEDEWCLKEGDDWFNFVADEIEQCTGLRDKNGKPIYEGDVLGGYEGYVKWCDRCKSFELFFGDECAACNGDVLWAEVVEGNGKLEAIGNVHKNPELIK